MLSLLELLAVFAEPRLDHLGVDTRAAERLDVGCLRSFERLQHIGQRGEFLSIGALKSGAPPRDYHRRPELVAESFILGGDGFRSHPGCCRPELREAYAAAPRRPESLRNRIARIAIRFRGFSGSACGGPPGPK